MARHIIASVQQEGRLRTAANTSATLMCSGKRSGASSAMVCKLQPPASSAKASPSVRALMPCCCC
eukprot:9471807-Pyramimonas_sp.AAC.2